jgi:hypothetical protein
MVSGYAAVADTIIGMNGFHPVDLTAGVKQSAAGLPVPPVQPEGAAPLAAVGSRAGPFGGIPQRVPAPESVSSFRGRRARSEARGDRTIAIGRELVELSGVVQLVEPGQLRAIGDAVVLAAERGYVDGSRSLREIVGLIDAELSDRGLEALSPFSGHPGDYARPRRYELAAALNRLRTLRIKA